MEQMETVAVVSRGMDQFPGVEPQRTDTDCLLFLTGDRSCMAFSL